MKTRILLAALAAATFATQPLFAEPPASPTPPAETQPAAPDVAEFDKHLERMQEHLKAMDTLMNKIGQTKNVQERRQLLQQYWGEMQKGMGMMHGMWGAGGLGCCAGGPGMMRGGPGGPGRMGGGPGMGPGMMGGGPGMGPGMMGGGPGMGPGMMGGMGWGRMQGYYSSLTPEQMKQRQYMNDQYLRMQQLMMEHMMQHQYWMNQTPPARR